jgi:TolB-like protein
MLTAGTSLGPYRILAPIGAGGMGEVYRAHDTRLGRDVAIKVLPAVFATDPERLRRFEQEARATAALNHPNILGIHDIGSHEGSPYLVEELLEGESLRQRLSGGALPYRKAVELATQVARGLAAAHAKGILHRDLKPENVFVTTEGVVKILDFGLAKLVRALDDVDLSAAPTATVPQAVMGTAAYMSPEQARGQPVDQRSDIFALGVVLYEMLSGHSPFRKATLADTTSAVLHEEPPPLAASVQNCPPPLDTVVRRCLEKRPEERFSSAHDLAIALEASSWEQPVARGAVPTVRPHRRSRRAVVLAATAIVLIAAAVVSWIAVRGGKGVPSVDPKRVAVVTFENKTGEASMAGVCALVTERITTGLSRVGGITVAADPAVALGSRGESVTSGTDQALHALALRSGAGLVIAGAVYAIAPDLEIQARLVAPGEGRVIYAVEPTRGPRAALDPAIDLLQQRILGAVATQAEGFWIDPAVMRPPTFDAYQELVRKREIYSSDPSGAIRHAERAVALDPRCLFTRWVLIAALMNQGVCEQAAQQVAAMEGLRGELTPFERHLLSLSTAFVARKWPEALTASRQMSELAPGLEWIKHDRAVYEIQVNLPRAAVATLSTAKPVPWGGLGEGSRVFMKALAQHMLGEYAEQLATVREGRARFPGDLRFLAEEAGALAALGRISELDEVVGAALAVSATSGSAGAVMLQGVLELRAHGHPDAATRVADMAVDWYRGRPSDAASTERVRSGLAGALVAAGKLDEAQAILAALAGDFPDEIEYRARLGVLAALRGDRAEAGRISEELRRAEQPCLYGSDTLARARIAAQLGDKEQAVALLRQAFSEGWPFGSDLHRDIDLEPLWDYPPFVELIRPKG